MGLSMDGPAAYLLGVRRRARDVADCSIEISGRVMGPVKYTEVFVPGGFPRHTYNPRLELQIEEKVAQVLENLCKLVIVTGHTKSGKTVLVRRVLPREEHVWVDGGTIGEEDDFWTAVIDQLNLY